MSGQPEQSYTASEEWNRSFMRQSHVEFAFMIAFALFATFFGSSEEAWRYIAAGIVFAGVIVGYLTVGVRAFKGHGRRGRRGARSDILTPGTDPIKHRRLVLIHLGITTVAAIILAWLFPNKVMLYLVFAIMTMVDAWHLLPKRRNIWQILLVLIAGIVAGLLLTNGAELEHIDWIVVPVSIAISAIGASLVVWTEIRNARETEKYVRLADKLEAAQSVIATQQHAAGVYAERERMAIEIHDTLAQGFLAIVTQSQVAAAALSRGRAEAALERLAVIEQVARDNLAEARGLIAATAPLPLQEAGLIAAIHNLGSRFSNETGIAVTVNTPDDGISGLSPSDEVVLLRAAQEALNNIRKHSEATDVIIKLHSDGNDTTILEITDNGIGITDTSVAGFGLTGMRDRVESVNGTMKIIPSVEEPPSGVPPHRVAEANRTRTPPRAGCGTTIRITLPIRSTE